MSSSLSSPRIFRRVVLCLIVLCGVFFCQPSSAFSASDPRACIQDLITAVDNADPDAFEQRLDVTAVTKQVFQELNDMGNDPQYASQMPPLLSLIISQGALTSPLFQPMLISEVRNFVRYGVGSGSFAGRQVQGYKSDSMLAPLFGLISMGRKEITRIERPLMGQDGNWIAPFHVLDHENGNTYRVMAVCAPVSDGWRIVAFQNIRQLIKQILTEAQGQVV